MTLPEPGDPRDDLLARVLTGEVPDDDPALVRAMQDPAFVRELRELRALTRSLDEAGVAAAAGPAASAPEPWPGADAAMRALAHRELDGGERARGEPRPGEPAGPAAAPPRARAPLRRWLVAVAATLALVFWLTRDTSPPRDVTLGRELLPSSRTTRADLVRDGFRWRDPDRPTTLGRFRVTVESTTGEPVDASPDLGTREQWHPDRANVDRYPDEIRWKVTLRIAGEEQSWQTSVSFSQ